MVMMMMEGEEEKKMKTHGGVPGIGVGGSWR